MQSLLSVFAGRGGEHKTTHGDFDLFIQEVNNENVEHLSFRRELDATKEVKPTFEQISQDRILDEANKNIQVLKSLETILQERSQAFETFLSAQARYKSSFDIFQYCEGTLRQSLDALFVFLEQDFQQARQQQLLNDLRRALSEVKVDAQKRLADYQREVNGAEKEVAAAEKRLSKSKDVLEKTLELRRELKHKLEMGDHERDQLTSPRMPGGILSRSMASSSHRESNRLERLRDCEETIARCEKDIREDIRCLLRALGRRDHVLIASRRAYQKLDRECRKAVAHTFRRLVVREREAAAAREVGLSKLEAAVQRMDVDADVDDFVGRHRSSDEEALQLSSQALTVLWDLMVPDGEVHAVSPASAALSDGGCGPSNNQSPSQLKHARDGSSRSHSRVSSPVQMAPLRSQGSGPDDAPPPPPAPAPSQGHTPQAARQPKFVVTDATLVDEVPAFATEVPDAVSLPIHATPQGRHRLIRYRPPHLPQYHALDGTHSSSGSGSSGTTSSSNSSSSSSSSNSTSTVSSAVTGSGMAVAATASATLSMAVAGGLPIVEAFASIVNMYGRQPEQPEQPSEPEEDVSTDTINEHLNRIFYGSINPFSPMPWTAPRHGADTPSTVPMTSVPSGQSPPPARSPEPADANTSADASLSDEDIKVTPMRVIGVDEVSIGAGPRAQLLLAQEGDKLEALQIEDYIGAADGDAWPPKSVLKSARKPAAMPSNVNTDSSGACGDAGGSTAAVAAGDGFALAAPSTERDGVGASDPTEVADDSSLDESVAWLSDVVRTQKGRDAFISALNQFRSKKVDVGDGFAALGAVLWDLLDQCSLSNDVHSAKVIMMLSQTFYRRRQPSSQQLAADGPPTPRQIASATASVSRGVVRAGLGSRSGSDSELDLAHFDDADPATRALDASDDADGTASSGARLRRDYLKDMLISHTIWRDGSFWEQVCPLQFSASLAPFPHPSPVPSRSFPFPPIIIIVVVVARPCGSAPSSSCRRSRTSARGTTSTARAAPKPSAACTVSSFRRSWPSRTA
jgi:hypothetical protein